MAMELVTGHAGAAHVSGGDIGAFNAKTIGSGTYILDSELPALTMTDANTLTVPVCEVLAEGRHVRITAPETVTIESGSQTGYRHDIVFLRYTLESTTSVETVEFVPVTGTTVASQSDVVDPTTEYSSASILDGATTVDIPFVRVSLSGLTPSVAWVVGTFDNVDGSINALDSRVETLETKFETHLNGCHIYKGSMVKDIGSSSTQRTHLWTDAGFESAFHVSSGHAGSCMLMLANTNYDAGNLGAVGAEYKSGSGWYAHWTVNATGNKQFGYVVVVPDAYSTV